MSNNDNCKLTDKYDTDHIISNKAKLIKFIYDIPETTNKNKERHNIDELNIKAELIIPTPTDIVAVHCIAPFWNTTETMNATINVKSGSPCRS